jgi:uncharacterized protein
MSSGTPASHPEQDASATAFESHGTVVMHELSRDDCLDLLAAHRFGRLAVVMNGRPVIRPVNYVFDPRIQSVVFRTARGSKLHAVLHAASASFEIDGINEATRTGWSVIIQGVVAEITVAGDLRRLHELGVEPWAPGHRTHWVRIAARAVSGRRIEFPADTMPAYYLG